MRVLLAVLHDLYQFVLQSLFGTAVFAHKELAMEEVPLILQPHLPLLPPGKKATGSVVYAHGDLYVCEPQTPVRLDPLIAFDNVLAYVPYGTAVKSLNSGARWTLVQIGDISGWVQKSQLADSMASVFPNFTIGSAYDATAQTTKALRLLIDDEFGCAEPALPLAGPEYVTYRLRQAGRRLRWPGIRPRPAGSWQRILRGQTGVHLGVVPKTGAVMECMVNDEGFVLYVDAVFPDERIQVSAVDYDGRGVYSENVFEREVWRELRPVFIEVL